MFDVHARRFVWHGVDLAMSRYWRAVIAYLETGDTSYWNAVTTALDVKCGRIGCEADPGKFCVPVPRFDGQPGGDPELAVSRYHLSRIKAARLRPVTE